MRQVGKFDTPFFKETNLNPKNKITGDCVIRAIANAEEREWLDVFDELVERAREEASLPNNSSVYAGYLNKKYTTIPVKYQDEFGKTRRLRPIDFKERGLGKGTYIVSMAHHLTCVRNGVTEDTWDSSIKSAYKIWKIK